MSQQKIELHDLKKALEAIEKLQEMEIDRAEVKVNQYAKLKTDKEKNVFLEVIDSPSYNMLDR